MLADAQRSCYVHQQMNTHEPSSKGQACGAQVASKTSSVEVSWPPQYQQLKLALDVQKRSNRSLEFKLGTGFVGARGFGLVGSTARPMEHGLSPFGRANLHPRRNPLDRQSGFVPEPDSDAQQVRSHRIEVLVARPLPITVATARDNQRLVAAAKHMAP